MVVRLRFGCGESAPSKTSKASTQPGYGTRFICGFPAARRRNDGHLVKYPFLNTCSRAASGHAIERVSRAVRLGGPRTSAEAVRVVLTSQVKSRMTPARGVAEVLSTRKNTTYMRLRTKRSRPAFKRWLSKQSRELHVEGGVKVAEQLACGQ